MSPFVFSADHAALTGGAERALFAEYAAAVTRNDRVRVAEIRLAADPQLLAELDGFDYPAAV